MKRFVTQLFLALLTLVPLLAKGAQPPKTLPQPDERFKADILLVVAHHDDEGAATPYLPPALDEHRRDAAVFGWRGDIGANEAGSDQATRRDGTHEVPSPNG